MAPFTRYKTHCAIPMIRNPLVIRVRKNAPSMVPGIFPFPPAMVVPPISVTAMAVIIFSDSIPDTALDDCAQPSIPAIKENTEHRIKAQIIVLRILIPANSAASRLSPINAIFLPNFVLCNRM